MATSDVLNVVAMSDKVHFLIGQLTFEPVLELRLFVNNHEVDCTTIASDLTECTLSGYAAYVLDPDTWTVGQAGCVITATYPPIVFTVTGDGTQAIYGHYVIETTFGNVYWGRTWDTPLALASGQMGTITIVPSFVDQQCPAS